MMTDSTTALTVSILGVSGTIAVALVTGSIALLTSRMAASSARLAQEREDEVRRVERQAEADRQATALAAADAAWRRDVIRQRIADLRGQAATFLACAQATGRAIDLAAESSRNDETRVGEDPPWNKLTEHLGSIMVGFPDDARRAAHAAVQSLRRAELTLGTRGVARDRVEELIASAQDQLDEFSVLARAEIERLGS
jgi:hypothetical protein